MDQLYSICWNITSKCNENCNFCYRKICNDNNLFKNKQIFDNLSNIKIGKISFCGGEPLLYEHLFDLVEYIKENKPDVKLSLTTNGKIINDEIFEKIIKHFDWVTLPIDSTSGIDNAIMGRGSDHFEKVLNLLEKFNNVINIKINTVATKNNIDDLENIYNIISKYNVRRWKIFRFYPIRNSKANRSLFNLTNEQSDNIKDNLNKLKESSHIDVQYNDFLEFRTSYFNIYSDGSIENSHGEEIGNLLNCSIEKILDINGPELINHYLRKR